MAVHDSQKWSWIFFNVDSMELYAYTKFQLKILFRSEMKKSHFRKQNFIYLDFSKFRKKIISLFRKVRSDYKFSLT